MLEAKISQYPPSDELRPVPRLASYRGQRKLEDEVQAIFNKSGMLLEESVN